MQLINNTILFVKNQLENAEGGHDWFHIERVYKNALLIAEEEECNLKSTLIEFIKDPNVNINDIIESYRRKFTRKYTLDVGVDNHVRKNIEFGTPWSFKEIQVHMNKK